MYGNRRNFFVTPDIDDLFCYRLFNILGQVAALHGKMEEAECHFAEALKEAKASRLPVLEVLAARAWCQYVLEPTGQDMCSAESVIGQACEKLGKTREQVTGVL